MYKKHYFKLFSTKALVLIQTALFRTKYKRLAGLQPKKTLKFIGLSVVKFFFVDLLYFCKGDFKCKKGFTEIKKYVTDTLTGKYILTSVILNYNTSFCTINFLS